MLGGTIRVESSVGKGSAFYFAVPYTRPAAESGISGQLKEKPDVSILKGLNILVAEDDETSVMLLRAALSGLAGTLTCVKDGREAVEFCMQHPDTDLVLMDIRLPGMNGYEATREIRKFNPRIIIIAQTAHGLAGDHEKALEAGCNDHLAKPILIPLLLKRINNYFNQ